MSTFDYEEKAAIPSRPHPTGVEFREQLRALPKSTEAPPSTSFLKPKPVKKVRVQSPPPSSPDSVDADFEARFPFNAASVASTGSAATFGGYGTPGSLLDDRPIRNFNDYSSESDDSDDSESSDKRAKLPSIGTTGPAPTQTQQQTPPNPFQQTFGDIETDQKSGQEAQSDTTATPGGAGKATLDVDAFRRLLLTGQAPPSGAPAPPQAGNHAADTASVTDASSTSQHVSFDTANIPQETPRTSHEVSENDDERSGLINAALPQTGASAQRQTLRKKPPPPSSRHGKLIKAQRTNEGGDGDDVSGSRPAGGVGGIRPSSSSSDVNKPLPPPPVRRSADDEDIIDSIFDREAAGKLPEVGLDPELPDDAVPSPRQPTPPNASHSTAFSPSHPISDLGAEALVSSIRSPATPSVSPQLLIPLPPQPKKQTPAPPPRRQAYSRSESKSVPQDRLLPQQAAPSADITISDQRDRSPVGSPRSSLDSTRSWSSSIKQSTINVPAPPPPRRANHATRLSASFAQPSGMSFATTQPASATSPASIFDSDRTPAGPQAAAVTSGSSSSASTSNPLASPGPSGPGGKLARPPPPPARNVSVRNKDSRPGVLSTDSAGAGSNSSNSSGRPESVASIDAVSRRITPHGHSQPPPPPRRQRGSSRGSTEGPLGTTTVGATLGVPTTPHAVGSESVRQTRNRSLPAAEEVEEDQEQQRVPGADGDAGRSAAHDILADLDALQREVDALRGQYAKPTGSS